MFGVISEKREMHTEVVTNLQECERLWKKFSKIHTLWDLWEVNHAFFDPIHHKPHFIVVKDEADSQGLLPLMFDSSAGKYYYFGGNFPENRQLLFAPESFPLIIKAIPKPATLYDINAASAQAVLKANPEAGQWVKEAHPHYVLKLAKFEFSIDKFLSTFSKKHRKNLLYDIKQLSKLSYKLAWNTTEHFDGFVNLNMRRFGQESDLSDVDFIQAMKHFVAFLNQNKMLHTLCIFINGSLEGIEIAAMYKNVYYVLNGGYNRQFSNIGKLLIFEHIKKAIELKAETVDFLSGDTGWKQLWNFEKEPYYQLEIQP
ncbi:MAG: GNAT family N-acetyltransferase [Candidatus Woesearchaeota archaeon]